MQKLIWAVNTNDPIELHRQVQFLLGAMTRASGAEVLPVHILPRVKGWPEITDSLRAGADEQLSLLTKNSDLTRILPGTVLVSETSSIRSQIWTLLDFCKRQHADGIVVSTHARHGLPRAFLGSFAETLMLESPVPVLSVNPATKVRERVSQMLFPTTFDEGARLYFEKAVEMARELDAGLTLFYKEPLIPSPFMSPEIYAFMDEEAKRRETIAKSWKTWGEHVGVAIEVVLDNRAGYVAPSIVNVAEDKKIDLIYMVTRASSVSAVLMGSQTRQVVREAGCPVLVVHRNET